MTNTVITPPEFAGWLSQAKVPLSLVVKHGDTVYVSGMPPIIPNTKDLRTDSIAGQVTQVMENITLCLRAAGSDLSKVLKCTILAVNAADFATINEAYRAYFRTDPRRERSARSLPGPPRSTSRSSASQLAERGD
jgi:2-iminobutanoate/2-iminopropanoate deaminase